MSPATNAAGRWAGAWRVAARVARRDAVRARGRTALVATMVGLPVLVGAVGGTLLQSEEPTPATQAYREFGDRVQASIDTYVAPDVEQSADATDVGSDEALAAGQVAPPTPSIPDYEHELAAALPAADRLVRSVRGHGIVKTVGRATGETYTIREYPVAEMAETLVPPVASGTLPTGPGEVALAHDVAARLGVGVGDEATVEPAGSGPVSVRVTAVLAPWPTGSQVVATLGALLTPPADAGAGDAVATWLVLGPDPVTWADVQAVDALGSPVASRYVITHPPADQHRPDSGGGNVPTASALVGAAVAAMGVLEAVLLIGPAFAVGARRSERQLALLAAAGAGRPVLRRVVLLGGAVVGLGTSLCAVAAGVGVAAAVRWVAHVRGSFVFPDLRVPWPLLAGLVVIGALVATAAALVPAVRSARLDVVATLGGRRAEARSRRGVPAAGVVLAVLGAVAAVVGATTARSLVLVGGVLGIEVGLVLASGGLVSLVGRLAPRLGVAGRFAARDAARQRGRTAPALAAIIAALAGLTTAVVYLNSRNASEAAGYRSLGAVGTVSLGAWAQAGEPPFTDAQLDAAAAALRARLPVRDVARVSVAEPPHDAPVVVRPGQADVPPSGWSKVVVVRAPDQVCPIESAHPPKRMTEVDGRCTDRGGGGRAAWVDSSTYSQVVVDDGTAVRVLGVPGSDVAAAALAAGEVVVPSPHDLQPDGTVHLEVQHGDNGGGATETLASADLPAVAVDLSDASQFAVVLPPSALDGLDLGSSVAGLVASTTAVPTQAQQDEARAALPSGPSWNFDVEEGPLPSENLLIWVCVGAALVLGLASTLVSVALAAAESRPDLATLGAVGAAPRARRRVAAAQAGVLAVTGALLGVLAGLLLGAVLVTARRYGDVVVDPTWVTVVPWPAVACVVVGVPAMAMGAAWLFTRSRLPMVRRVVG